jgi:LPXTG-site transpeptidase (sortase) family protein
MPKKRKKKSAPKAKLSHQKKKKSLSSSFVASSTSSAPQATKSSHFKRLFFTVGLIIIGLNIFAISGLYLLYKKTTLSFAVAPVVTADAHLRRDIPTHVSIDAAKISLDIQEAAIENGVWQTSNTNATHLNTSMRPGEGGNIVIYGHNLRKIFGPLRVVKIGDKINIDTEDGKKYEYTVQNIETVSPKQIDKVLPTDHEVLTIYTCTGLLDSQRLVITAFPSRVSR